MNSSNSNIRWPKKSRELFHNHFDSTIWNDFKFRDDDIFIGTYAKSGTTWLQQIVGQLVFNGDEDVNVAELSPWIDLRLPPKEVKLAEVEAQTHRRFLKTHLPVDALVYSPKAKYIYIARDGRDVVWSFYNHHSNFKDEFYENLNGAAGPDVEPLKPVEHDVDEYFRQWLARDGYPLWSYWENIATWWAIRDLPNCKLLHFAELKRDLAGQIREIAAFLEIPIDESTFDAIVEHCTFEYMHKNAERSAPLGGAVWKGGAQTFIHKGTNGRWRDVLTEADNQKYEAMAVEKLGDECAQWLKTGSL